MNRSILPLIALTLLAGCSKAEEQPATNQAESIIVRSADQKKLFKLKDLDRSIALKRAIQSQDLVCKQVVSSGFVGRYKNMDLWTAMCGDKRQWALFISANDMVQVRLCDDNVKLGLPACTIQSGTEAGSGTDEINVVKAS